MGVMGVMMVIVYTGAIWLALAILMIGLLNLAKWSVRAAARTAHVAPPQVPTSRLTLPSSTPEPAANRTLGARVAPRAASAWPKPTR